jgi:hypothetical protein
MDLTNSIEPSVNWEAASQSATQQFSNILLNPKFHYRVHKNSLLVSIRNEINRVHFTTSYFSKIAFIYRKNFKCK